MKKCRRRLEERYSCFVFFFVSEYHVTFHLEFDTGEVWRVKTKRLKFKLSFSF
ncbi:hypothetical protein CKAN_01019700 [Cinnamomum micranthum f. kanehirae]|uniref:Uncharacterized protein n=1 Tax=Cinnamomum micranthum f. kanehirae TaxID=337451 RepID=A0A443NSL3_9MAGN|nr:hypothetical protein CKAN_01019700 [Cinnamomum micranthum f. kanehirae]